MIGRGHPNPYSTHMTDDKRSLLWQGMKDFGLSICRDIERCRAALREYGSKRQTPKIGIRMRNYPLRNLARLARTVRYMRTGQIVNRIARRFKSLPPTDGAAPALRVPRSFWRNCPGRLSSMLSPQRFRFIGRDGELEAASGWNRPDMAKLWLYNLHYFDDLRAEGATDRLPWQRDLIARWIAENPPAAGNGWEPYPASLRIVNWIAWALAGNDLGAAALQSLAVQVRVLGATLEYHLLGNHLLANAKALVFAGCFFSGDEAEGWLRTGLDLLDAEFAEQILGDGAHFELSPMYHAVILEDVLDLIQLSELFPAQIGAKGEPWRELAARMLDWLDAMSHPDGEISFFNDAAFGIARTYQELAAYGAWFGVAPSRETGALRRLSASGYIRLRSGPFAVIFDTAEIGPSYLPGHGHADVLSLEVSLDGKRLLTNGGTSSYDIGPVRAGERATAAHATLEVDGHDSSEVWSSFRVGRRAHPFDVAVTEAGGEVSATASHDGYRWLPGKPVHRRRVVLSPASLSIQDSVTGDGDHAVVARFPLHPSVTIVAEEPEGWRLELAGSHVVRVRMRGCSERFVAGGYYAPTFCQRMARPVLTWRHNGRLPLNVETRFEL
jgi:uncharacterized heparinase superfamily protein